MNFSILYVFWGRGLTHKGLLWHGVLSGAISMALLKLQLNRMAGLCLSYIHRAIRLQCCKSFCTSYAFQC